MSMPRFHLPVILALALWPLSSCGLLKKRLLSRKYSPVPKEQAHDMFLGVVESVNPEQKFVLVRMDVRVTLAPGTKLETLSANGTRGALLVTPEHKMNFLSADITGGSPAQGDFVILHPQPAAVPPSASLAAPMGPGVSPSDPVPGVLPGDGASLPLPVR